MQREQMADLTAFLAVAEERSFTRAAVRLGLSQSALSQIMRRLEESLGVRLLTRTTRSVAPTDAGERLMRALAPTLEALDSSLASLNELRDKPAGTIRITSVEHATETVLWPALKKLLATHPAIRAEIISDYGLSDIVAERFDAGVRLGEDVDKDMVAIRIAPDLQMKLVGAPSYFRDRPMPKKPQELLQHRCINLRLSSSRGNYPWPFKKGARELRVRPEGPVAFNTIHMILEAVLGGVGLAFLPVDRVEEHIAHGRLMSVLGDWCPTFPGYHLYYPSRRQLTPAFALLVAELRRQHAEGPR
jgi:LysR family transcriptional regulator, regulator of peptidoglycan recycling